MAGDRDELEDQYARFVISPELQRTVDTADLEEGSRRRARIALNKDGRYKLIIEANLNYPGGVERACARIIALLSKLDIDGEAREEIRSSRYYVFASLHPHEMEALVRIDQADTPTAIFKVLPSHRLEAFIDRSVRLTNAAACHRTFDALGEGVVWAVIDSGIDGRHDHFKLHRNLDLEQGAGQGEDRLRHRDFTGGRAGDALRDVFGHGTHVAGILGGASDPDHPGWKLVKERDSEGRIQSSVKDLPGPVTGMAPKVKLVSLKVLDDEGEGDESFLIEALEHVAKVNGARDNLRIHGVNISLGYPFLEPEWFATGHSPVCRQVNRLVASGVVVVVAAGNDGSANIQTEGALRRVGMGQTIADPGNAERAITVGSTHAEEPLRYGVSYFSSKGPTADGRLKPDLIAPGERILSCASAHSLARGLDEAGIQEALPGAPRRAYRQDTGTSMAAPHVSGAIAAFMSARSELKGEPQRVKDLLMDNATNLGRQPEFQGAGLIDLMRAMQAQIHRPRNAS